MANEIRFFELNTGAKIPSVGLGTAQADPGLFGDAVEAAVKVSQSLDRKKSYTIRGLIHDSNYYADRLSAH